MRHVVMFSGGVGSAVTALRVAEQHGTDNLILLFADTLVEEADLYRFRDEAAGKIGGELVVVADGRTPFKVFEDRKWLGNSRLAHCSQLLKQEPCRTWIAGECDPDDSTLYVGIDWSEEARRLPRIRDGWAPYRVEAPLCEPPLLLKEQMLSVVTDLGLEPPLSYAQGFPHANCMAQGCVKGGTAYWRHLLRVRPDVFRATEAQEQEIRGQLGDVTILTVTRGGERQNLPLVNLREQEEAAPSLLNDEWGGCGCFTEGDAGDAA
jgi:hypothetical protein